MLIVPDYRYFRIEVVAQFVDGAWNAGMRIRRVLSDEKPHVEYVTCRKATAAEAEHGASCGRTNTSTEWHLEKER